MVLSALLPIACEHKLKLIYMCRTHVQSDRVILELKKIHDSSPNSNYSVSGLSISGRNEMCLNSALLRAKVNPTEAMAMYKNLRVTDTCVYYRNVNKSTKGFKGLELFYFTKLTDAEELIAFCKEKRYCPYFLSKSLLKDMPVVVCNFQWLFNPDIRFGFLKMLGVDLSECIIVVDEAHNIVDIATEVNSAKLTPSFLTKSLNDLQQSGVNEKYAQFVRFIRNHLNQKNRDLSFGEKKIDATKFLTIICKKLKLSNISEFKTFISQLEEDYKYKVEQNDNVDNSKTTIRYLVKFWQKWCKNHNSEKFFFCYSIKTSGRRKFIALEIVALDPRDITLPLFRNNYTCVNLSGTVNPKVFNHLTGLHWKKKGYKEIIAESPFKKSNILALLTEGVDTGRDNRKPFMYEKIIHKIKEVITCTPENIGIF